MVALYNSFSEWAAHLSLENEESLFGMGAILVAMMVMAVMSRFKKQ